MTNAFAYCTLQDLIDASDAPVPSNALHRAILPASRYLLGEIGQFIPTLESRRYRGETNVKSRRLFVDPFTTLVSLINDDDTLTSTDYESLPLARHWQDGPYSWLHVKDYATQLSVWNFDDDGVLLTALFGLYEKVEALNTTLNGSHNASVTTLAVNNGAKVSPGMVLYFDSEQIYVGDYDTPTSAITTLGAALDASSEIVTLIDGSTVKAGEIIRVNVEKMRVLDINGNTAYVLRGWDKTKQVSHTISANVDVYRTFNVTRGVNGTTAVSHSNAAALSRYVVPEDINYLTVQIATLMLRKSATGFAGKTGNETLGTVFYAHEFPRDEIARVKSSYYIPVMR